MTNSYPPGYCLRLQYYRPSVAAGPITSPADCCFTYAVAHLFSCQTQPTELAPGDMWMAHLQVSQFLAGLPQFNDLPPLQFDFDSFGPPTGPHHLHLTLQPISFHPGSEGHLPPPLSNSNNRLVDAVLMGNFLHDHFFF